MSEKAESKGFIRLNREGMKVWEKRIEEAKRRRQMSEQDAKREARKYKKSLKDLTTTVSEYVARIDVLMEQPSTPERGKEIARLSNALEYANDQARYFGLGIDYRKDAKYKEALERKGRELR